MSATVLIVAGALGLAYDAYLEIRPSTFGPLAYAVSHRPTVPVPIGTAVGAITAGTLLLLVRRRRRHGPEATAPRRPADPRPARSTPSRDCTS